MRTVFETEQFAVEKLKIRRDLPQLDEILRSLVYFALARDPTCGQQSETVDVWGLVIHPFPGISFTIYYSFTETSVALLSVTRGSEKREDYYGT